jgi:hypothetical protein
MENVYITYNEEGQQENVETIEYTTPEQIVMLWQEAQTWKEAHNMRWDEFISLVVGR